MTGLLHRQNREKHIGCMYGFFQIFDRQQILARKRIHSAKRSVSDSPETLSSGESQQLCNELKMVNPVENEYENVRKISPVARLMGLEPLSSHNRKAQQCRNTTPTLPRSGSECRVSRDPVHSKYIDNNNFQLKQPNQSHNRANKSIEYASESLLEKRLKMRGMDEQLNELSALKQIIEVLQLKGLLHSNESSLNMKQSRPVNERVERDGGVVDRSLTIPARAAATSPNRIESNLKSCNSIVKRKPLSVDIERRSIASSDISRTSPIDSSKLTPKKTGSVHHTTTNQYLRNGKLAESTLVDSPQRFIRNVVTEDEPASILQSIVRSPSTTELEVSEREGRIDGKRLLERCGKLIDSIAEMSSATESPPSSATVLPSPVSVLDSGFDKDDSSSPSHSIIDFKDSENVSTNPTVDFDEDNWTPKSSPTKHQEFISHDSDFIYISKILQAPQHDSTIFFTIEKQYLHNSENIQHHRKLVFDVIREILDKITQLPPWKTCMDDSRTTLKQVWCDFQKLQEVNINIGGDIGLLEVISGVLKKEVDIKGWDDYPIETSEVILDVERLIFKDLVSEVIKDLVEFSGECIVYKTRRKLVF